MKRINSTSIKTDNEYRKYKRTHSKLYINEIIKIQTLIRQNQFSIVEVLL